MQIKYKCPNTLQLHTDANQSYICVACFERDSIRNKKKLVYIEKYKHFIRVAFIGTFTQCR